MVMQSPHHCGSKADSVLFISMPGPVRRLDMSGGLDLGLNCSVRVEVIGEKLNC